ncbi:S-adenosylmethionine decarboxylase [Synechococcus phage S-M1]|uniref:S-adenosylmethionine decarboxylase proenzyme prokaryotic class 1B n=1 Tax=Synechococcus phage QB2 TaxID=3159453 RepID=A0AAU8EHV1_9CAUD|nr:S-adenosylmethionine decarboxylase [Synechococcus phage S-M1]
MRHILFTLKGCDTQFLDDENYVRDVVYHASVKCQSTLLALNSHKFDPQGVTCVAMLAESHISIHTWPELGMAVCDVFTCGDHTTPQDGVEYMRQMLHASNMISREFVRPLE